MEFVEQLQQGAPASVIYKPIRRIKGKPQYKINILREGNRTFTTRGRLGILFIHLFVYLLEPKHFINSI